MKKKILIILLACLISTTCFASWVFNSGTDKVVITDSNTLDFASADFAIAFWWKMPANAGSAVHVPMALGEWDDTPSIEFWFYGTDDGTYGDDIRPIHKADNAVQFTSFSTSDNDVLDNTSWNHFVMQLNSGFMETWVNGTRLINGSAANAVDTYTFANGMIFGQDFSANDAFVGSLAEACSFQRILTDGEIDELSGTNGETATSPADISQTSIKWYFKMYDELETTSETGGLTATHTNTSFDSGDHPVSYGSGTTIPIIMNHRRRR